MRHEANGREAAVKVPSPSKIQLSVALRSAEKSNGDTDGPRDQAGHLPSAPSPLAALQLRARRVQRGKQPSQHHRNAPGKSMRETEHLQSDSRTAQKQQWKLENRCISFNILREMTRLVYPGEKEKTLKGGEIKTFQGNKR